MNYTRQKLPDPWQRTRLDLWPARILFAITIATTQVMAQPPAQVPPPPAAVRPANRGGGGFAASYPQRPPGDPTVVARGKALYGVHCNFCHGSDARGGEGGPNLLRSELVLNDQKGELIAPVVQSGRGEMPKLNLTNEQVSDIAVFVHSFRVSGYDISRTVPLSILVGDAKAGEAVFKTKCGACHSVAGDLKGIASKIPDPKTLQNMFLMPSGGRGMRGGPSPVNVPPTTVTVTLDFGLKIQGRLVRIDDFIVTLIDADEIQRTFRRDGDNPKVEIHDPLQPHKDLLPVYTDSDIHNLTAYLVTVK
jgi:cytochrome c oxidase cbb3-type subunit 3